MLGYAPSASCVLLLWRSRREPVRVLFVALPLPCPTGRCEVRAVTASSRVSLFSTPLLRVRSPEAALLALRKLAWRNKNRLDSLCTRVGCVAGMVRDVGAPGVRVGARARQNACAQRWRALLRDTGGRLFDALPLVWCCEGRQTLCFRALAAKSIGQKGRICSQESRWQKSSTTTP